MFSIRLLLSRCSILFVALGIMCSSVHAKIQVGTITPYAKQDGETYILLGLTRHQHSPTAWSDFGGSQIGPETPHETALREFFEECPSMEEHILRCDEEQEPMINDRKYTVIVYTFFAEVSFVPVDQLSLSGEVEKLAWVKAADFLALAADNVSSITSIEGTKINRSRTNTSMLETIAVNKAALQKLWNIRRPTKPVGTTSVRPKAGQAGAAKTSFAGTNPFDALADDVSS